MGTTTTQHANSPQTLAQQEICQASNDKQQKRKLQGRLLTMGPLHAATSQKSDIETWHGLFEASFIPEGSLCVPFSSLFHLVQLLKGWSATCSTHQAFTCWGTRLCFDFFQTFVK